MCMKAGLFKTCTTGTSFHYLLSHGKDKKNYILLLRPTPMPPSPSEHRSADKFRLVGVALSFTWHLLVIESQRLSNRYFNCEMLVYFLNEWKCFCALQIKMFCLNTLPIFTKYNCLVYEVYHRQYSGLSLIQDVIATCFVGFAVWPRE